MAEYRYRNGGTDVVTTARRSPSFTRGHHRARADGTGPRVVADGDKNDSRISAMDVWGARVCWAIPSSLDAPASASFRWPRKRVPVRSPGSRAPVLAPRACGIQAG